MHQHHNSYYLDNAYANLIEKRILKWSPLLWPLERL